MSLSRACFVCLIRLAKPLEEGVWSGLAFPGQIRFGRSEGFHTVVWELGVTRGVHFRGQCRPVTEDEQL